MRLKNIKTLSKKLFFLGYIIILAIIFISPTSIASAETCADKYPGGDGTCIPSADKCPNLKFPDKATGLCPSDQVCCHQYAAQPQVELQVPIFSYTKATNIAEYITKIYEYFLVVLTPIAIVIMIWAGIKWILAAGEPSKIQEAKKYISGAFTGLTLALVSYVVLSFIGLTSIELPGIAYIEGESLPARGGTIISGGKASRASGPIAQYDNAACPNMASGETEIEVYFTNYYKPAYGEKASYVDFFCNIAVQCSCPKGRDNTRNCGLFNISKDGYRPCAYFPAGTSFCGATSSGRKPVANYTIAADLTPIPKNSRGTSWSDLYGHKGCYKMGCKFTILDDPKPGTVYVMEDRGSAIIGRHMDFYAGEGQPALRSSPISGTHKIKLDQGTCMP